MTTPIAIVGMGAVFPGAGTARAFWRNIRAGVDAISEVPAHRWDPEVYYDPDPDGGRFYCRRGGFVDELATFDPTAFGIMPAAVDGIEPDQLLALRTAAEAIADAGGEDRLPDRSRIGVVIGRGGYITPALARFDQRVHISHQLVAALRDLAPGLEAARLEEIRRAFCARLGPDGPDAATGLVPNFAASRIANRFDLHGPAYTVDAACASALLAVEHAVRALRGGQCDAMLAGAVHHAHHITLWSVFSRLRALSPSERIRPFDRSADGTLLSEGTGMVLLKRLEDAERAGDRVYAVIRGVGSSSDGRAAGLMNPLIEGQLLAVRRAWRDAGLDPRDPGAVGLLEAHGTATPVGDGVELQTLRHAFGTAGPPVGLGTVKSMIGHAMPAAGVAGLIKAVHALHDGVLPPTLHVTELHPALEGTRFRPVRETAEWEAEPGVPRRAAVNAFGFGGANAHVVLEESPASVRARLSRPPRRTPAGERAGGVLRLAAASPEELAVLLAEPDEVLLAGAGEVRGEGPCRLAIADPTSERLALARTVVARGRPWRGRGDLWFTPRPLLGSGGRVAFVFPGFEPVFRPRVDGIAERFGLPGPALTGRGDLLGHAADVIAVGRLLADALRALGVEPDVAAGHSLGEWTAMIAAGMYSRDAADGFLAALEEGTVSVPDVIYGALGCGAARAAEAIAGLDGVVVSHDNCPHHSVICGVPGTVREVLHRLGAEGILGQELPFRSGFHTPMAAGYLDVLRGTFNSLPIERPAVPVWSATTVAPFPQHPDEVRALVVRHLLEPVRFSELIERLYTDAGVRAFVQVGPGGLTGFVADRLGSREHLAVAANVPARTGPAQLDCVVAALWVDGHGTAPAERAGEPSGPAPGLRLNLGTPLIRLKDAVPPLTGTGGEPPPALPAGTPVMAEFDALMRDTVTGARTVLEALGTATASAEATRTTVFSLETMPHLADHCLIPQRNGWPDPSDRFPVVPLTALLEVMAEAARELLPDRVVVGFESVRALRWVVAAPPTTADVHARITAPGRVEVRIGDSTDGVVVLADRYPRPPAPDRTPLTGEGPPAVTAERFYAERWMFHGPGYQGVREIHALAGDGLRAGIAALPAPGAPLDAAGQLCGHWIQVYGDKDQTTFPIGVERVAWYGPPPPEGERLDVTVRNRAVSATTVRCDAELVRADGTVWGRLDGWTMHRFHTDELIWRMKFTPELSGIGEPRPGGWCLVHRRWQGVSSRDLLMRHYLCAAERAEFERLSGRAQGPWLLGRIAAKDAVRHWLWEHGHGPLFPAELTVRTDAAGRPEVSGPFDTRLAVSIAHTPELGAALVRPAPQPAGIDVAAVVADTGPIEDTALTDAERTLLDRLAARPGTDRATAATRLWTAKEAAAKAAGTGLQGRPRDFPVTAADGDRLLVAAGPTVTAVETCLVDGHVVTWTVTPPED